MNRLLVLKPQLVAQTEFDEYRRKSTIDKEEFNRIVNGPNYKERMRAFKVISENPTLFQHYHLTEASRSSQRQNTTKQVFFLKKHIGLEDSQTAKMNPNKFTLFGNGLTFYDLNLTTKIGVHYSLYIKTLERLGTAKHHEYYQRACNFRDIGCFGLTQLMHGSNVKGILTQAHYNHETRDIIIHSPSKEAMKFWIGGSAKTSNMSVIWAQLYIGDTCYGVHAFVVPLRDPITHKVLPGIIIGDCGPKFGLNAIDNGFIMFDKFKIPVDNLLDKVSGINQKGEFFSTVEGENKRFGMTLAALSQGRLYMCCHSTTLGLSALAIALRYTFVRSQFTRKAGQKETLLINYPLTKRRMIPLLAQEIIYMTVTMKTFNESENNQEKNVLSPSNPLLQQIHAISSVLKSKTAWASTQTIRECRQMMGGHGFSAYSKMGALYSNNDVNNTWEGENHVLIQQTTKYVLQNFQKSLKGKQIKSPTLKFLSEPLSEQRFEIDRQFLVNLDKFGNYLKRKIFTKVQEMGLKMMNLKEQKIPSTDIWNNSQVFLGQAIAINTGDLYILNSCLQRLSEIKDANTKKVFKDILHLWSLLVIRNDQYIGQEHHGLIERIIMEYCQALTPEILGLLEVVAAGESVIGSPFANEDGKGFDKYVKFVLEQPRKDRSDYWKLVADF